MNVALTGITGYAGMQLYNLLKNHPQVDQINVYQHDLKEAIDLAQLNPKLGTTDQEAYPYNAQAVMNHNQVIFFATPAGVTAELATPYLAANFPVIDLSGDFRLPDPKDYENWYHKTPAQAEELEQAYYGLADLEHNPGKTYVANPGCYATATLLGLAPAVQDGLIEPDSIIVDAKSGLSGAGKSLTPSSHFVQANENLQVYKANEHKHIPEILNTLQGWNNEVPYLQFMTTLVPMDKGILASIYAKVKPGYDEEDLIEHYQDTYADSPFVTVFNEGLPDVKSVVNTNDCKIGLAYNPVTNTVLIVSVIDNMLKGAAGQAVQNFNQLFDFDITDGLHFAPTLY
ncbi:N-acetyl-gamma-glutamyl-phosphate reductase [Leuconostocaceae bacterium ESL0723]|nr:N-acetyl-gamma-glutamyl-phosphate reductase [Leuconostocaceae bacterium ESL0723]